MVKLKRVLLVDDDAVTMFLNTLVLEEMGCAESVISASNGEEAYNLLLQDCNINLETECWLDLLLLDIHMPIMDGFEFLKAFRNTAFKCLPKIVLLTSSTHPDDMQMARNYNLAGIIEKPLTKEKLEAILKNNFGCCHQ